MLEVNQSRKNLYLLKCSPSTNLRTLLLGSTSFDRQNANELRKKPPASFVFLYFFSFFFLLSFLLSSISLFLSSSPLLLLRTNLFILLAPSMQVDTWFAMCHTHGLPCVTHMAYHVSSDTRCFQIREISPVSESNEEDRFHETIPTVKSVSSSEI